MLVNTAPHLHLDYLPVSGSGSMDQAFYSTQALFVKSLLSFCSDVLCFPRDHHGTSLAVVCVQWRVVSDSE